MSKVFVEVILRHMVDGQKLPMTIVWEDGRSFAVDRIIDVRRAASLKAGGCGLRYTCRIQGKDTYLFLEQDKWFVEGR